MTAKTYPNPSALLGQEGTLLGPTDYVVIDQQRINQFADATGDHQWIHVDEARAQQSEFGGTIAHGYLTLSLANLFLPQMLQVENFSMGVNYGAENIRFPSAVKVNSRVRGRGEIIKVDEAKGGIRSVVRITVEIEGVERPACLIDTISLYYP
ncbi:MAG: MaoC family dehydratase [Gammaproteobacteria bacterium]|uniref:MaoC family dehydratase n=1 Tax=Pseudomaricurvus alcaniphilus TaxID=1166482 RepID=UPI0014097C23|nr:MaoC family dehydratase [Pseudomaricurvus alcaniphilus]MBR9913160.1 MaoC family dehydratase [Gammaproteobacteria bacterium]NHN36434.1 MaoC family dehydratase [Pseudomaricurvus alcaniphilus]